MSEQLNEMPVYSINQDYINRLEKRVKKLRERLNSYRWYYGSDAPRNERGYRHKNTNRRMSREKYDELKKQYQAANQKLYSIANRERQKITSKSLPYLGSFLVMDKRQNPGFYPEWLSFKLPDPSKSDSPHIITPFIDLEKALQSGDNWGIVSDRASRRMTLFYNRYFPNDAINLKITSPKILGIDDYIKNVFRKEIRKKIKDIDKRDCIHSIVFRNRNWNNEVQIHPRFRDRGYCYSWTERRQITKAMEDVLAEYGWKRGTNYTDSTQRD